MSNLYLELDMLHILQFVVKPIVTVIAWFVVDKLLIHLRNHTQFIDKMITSRTSSSEGKNALTQRINTFRGLFIQLLRILNAIFFIFILLGNFGIDPKPLLAGIGVVGLGLSLAAQNILRDFLNGMFILIEDQYNVDDFITTNGVAGTVEVFTMRTTKLRTLDGSLVTIPNGTITQVVNSTKNYSVAVIPIPLPYDCDFATVTEALTKSGQILRERFPNETLADPMNQGVIEFLKNRMTARVLVKTRPGEQWGIEREFRAIVHDQFLAAGIEFPKFVLDSDKD